VKSWLAFTLADLAPATVTKNFYNLQTVSTEQVTALLNCKPQDCRSIWKQLVASGRLAYQADVSLKSLISFACRFQIGDWGTEWLDLVSQLPLRKVDKYASVRTGAAFLSVEEESKIVGKIDDVCKLVQNSPSAVSDDLLESSCILLCSYQFFVRSKQIAMLEMRNIRVWDDGLADNLAVHVTFVMIKQRRKERILPMVRPVKREWTPLFIELHRRAKSNGMAGADHIFHCTPIQLQKTLGDLTELILGNRRTCTELRHTGAQRLVDQGATEEELADALGHTDLDTGRVYYDASPSQAEIVNRAYGASPVYQRVAKIAHHRFISIDELASLKGEQQIAGVPHGIPIAGIGGCSLGQPNCPHNPIMSCYGCLRFLPVNIRAVHEQVLTSQREIFKIFYSSSRAERGSPAFQLTDTISDIQGVLEELGDLHHELKS
jgi:integrase